MKKPLRDFSPLNSRQKSLIQEIESRKIKLKDLSPGDADLKKIYQEIDELTIKAVRFLVKNTPDGDRSSGLFRLFIKENDSRDGYKYSILIDDCVKLHPEAPDWFVYHLWDWRQRQRLDPKGEGRENLRETGLVGLETGIKRRKSMNLGIMNLGIRVLELRGVKGEEENGPLDETFMANDPPLDSLQEMKEKHRQKRRVTDETLRAWRKNYKSKPLKQKARTRKNFAPWERVIEKLVKEKLLPKKISRQALKKRLKSMFPEYPWDEV